MQPIEVILNANIEKEIEDNRKKLAPIVDTVIFCGRLGLPLRSHRDAKWQLLRETDYLGGVSRGAIRNNKLVHACPIGWKYQFLIM